MISSQTTWKDLPLFKALDVKLKGCKLEIKYWGLMGLWESVLWFHTSVTM